MYKIFINDKPFIITATDVADARFKKCERVTYEPAKTATYLKECDTMRCKGYVLITDDPDFAFADMTTHTVPIEAAGGVVFNQNKQVLLIKRLGKWDLPKGKIDAGEGKEEAALREVMEECSVDGLQIIARLPNTYHIYKMHNFRFLKITYWYSMQTNFSKTLKPQIEEHITEAKWFDWDTLNLAEMETYISIVDLLDAVRE